MKCCEGYEALLDLYVDGELTPEELAQVRAHINGCPGCQAYVDDALAIRAGFPDVEDTLVPENFAEDAMERIRKSSGADVKIAERKRRPVRRWMGTAGALAACCALVILAETGLGGWKNGENWAEPAGADQEEGPVCYSAADDVSAAANDAAASQAAPEAAEKKTEFQVTARSGDDRADRVGGETIMAALPAEAAPETTMDAAPDEEAVLRLTAEEAGNLLDDFTPIWESAGERCYELSAEEGRTLLEALGRTEENTGTVTVIVMEAEE